MQKALRDAAVARFAERAMQLKEQKAQVKHEQGRFAVRQQMKVHEFLLAGFDIIAIFFVCTTDKFFCVAK